MSPRQQIFLLRLRMAAKHNIRRAVDMLRAIGKSLREAVRIVALIRSVA